MPPVSSLERLAETLARLAGCMRSDIELLERLRLELIERQVLASDIPGGAVSPATSPGLAEVHGLARRLEQVVDWLETSDHDSELSDWESWQSRSGPPTVPGVDVQGADQPDDRWWVPSLLLLAAADPARSPEADELLRGWMGVRSRLSHLVIDEIVDGVAGLSASPWPVVDDAGRLRFPTDWLAELAVPVGALQRVVDDGRARFLEVGLISDKLANRPVDLGDVFAAEVSVPESKRPHVERDVKALAEAGVPQLARVPWHAQVLAVAGEWFDDSESPAVRVRAGGLEIMTNKGPVRVAGPTVTGGQLPIVDVTYDAREQAKMAFAGANEAGGSFAGLVAQVDQQLQQRLSAPAADAT